MGAPAAADLRNAGIVIVLDQRDAGIGTNIARFISGIAESEYVIVVGTTSYAQKYENRISAYGSLWPRKWISSISGSPAELQKLSVLPVLLEGTEHTALPPLVRGRVYADFRDDTDVLPNLLDLILRLNDLRFDDPAIAHLRESVGHQTMRLVA